jgi:SPX domain protein involved in polyphosphate accumulation
MRYEIKFNIKNGDLPWVMKWLQTHNGFHTSYPSREVHSIYLDTLELDCAYDNLCGISDRKKYRIRWYDNGKELYGARYELKIKKSNLGTKQILHSTIPNSALSDMSSEKIIKHMINDKVNTIWKIQPLLIPILNISYKRIYFQTFSEIRVTVDNCVRFIDMRNRKCNGSRDFNGIIIEIKFEPKYRDLIAEMLKDFPFYPVRTSKYVLGLSYFDYVNYI